MDKHDFYIQMEGKAMIDAGINDNALLRVVPELNVEEGSIVVCRLHDKTIVRKYFKSGNTIFLVPSSVDYPTIEVPCNDMVEICGVVTEVLAVNSK